MNLTDSKKLPSIDCMNAAISVGNSRTLTDSARELGCSQPTLTVKVKKLEDALGVSLFDRPNYPGGRIKKNDRFDAFEILAEKTIKSVQGMVKDLQRYSMHTNQEIIDRINQARDNDFELVDAIESVAEDLEVSYDVVELVYMRHGGEF